MYLSGSVGYTLLKHKSLNKYIFLLADVHDGVSYCSNDSVMIDRWLSLKDNNDILLEEAVRENFELTDLWPGAEHTQRLKILNRNNKKIKPVDIRPLLIPFSWELLRNIDNKQSNMILEEYLSYINNIFNYKKSKLMIEYIVKELKKLKSDGDIRMKNLLLQHFQEMKEIYMEFINTNKSDLHKPMKELFNINPELLEEINNIISMIMEWYILLLILNSKENCIIHLGLAHSNRILEFLVEVYSFEIIKESGITVMEEIINNPNACLLVPDDINTKFK